MSDDPLESAKRRLGMLLASRLHPDFAEVYLRRVEWRLTCAGGRVTVSGISAADPLQALADELWAKAPKGAFTTHADDDPTVPRSTHYLDVLRARLEEQRQNKESVVRPVEPKTRRNRE
jgi:acetyl esterase/lipase